MSKKQVLLISIVAALPAAALVAVLVMAGFQGYANQWTGMLWGINVLAGLLAAVVAVSPVLVGLLYPAAGFAAAGVGATALGPGETFHPTNNDDSDEDIAPEDDGEQLFDDEALEDGFDDDFEGSFDDDRRN